MPMTSPHWGYSSVALLDHHRAAIVSWYGTTTGSYPPYGHGAHHTTAHIHLAIKDPTTNLIRY